jgi:hypothetical protein
MFFFDFSKFVVLKNNHELFSLLGFLKIASKKL